MYTKSIGYPRSNKYKILDKYIKDNDIIKISEIPAFTNKLKSIHSACLRLNICLKRVDNYTYKKLGVGYWKKDYIYKYKRVKSKGRKRPFTNENYDMCIGY